MAKHITYKPLWKKLIDQKMTRTQMAERVGISRNTLAKMGKDEHVSLDIIERICDRMDLKVSDVIDME